MSNGHPPICDAICQKIILDGDLAGKVFESTCERIEAWFAAGNGPLADSDKILDKLIKAEDAAFAFQRAVLEGMGYHGPWPKCLDG
jgi:hypothetical protein